MSDSLELSGKCFLVAGAATRRSVAFHIGKRLQAAGAQVVWTVHSEARREELGARIEGEILVCDVEDETSVSALGAALHERSVRLNGFVHSIAFANYEGAPKPFHATTRSDFLQAVDVSCFSFIALANALAPTLEPGSSAVTISISSTQMAASGYGFMAPAKAALDSAVTFLAKSFSGAQVRFNSVKAGLLKTNSSAGIPGYLESYLFAEACTLRGKGVETFEVADTALFLLSPRSSGINAQGIVVDAGMGVNYFDEHVVERATRSEE